MAKEKLSEKPAFGLSTILHELKLINEQSLFLKIASTALIDAVEAGDLKRAKTVIDITNIKDTIKALTFN